MKNILLIGGAGFIGSALVSRFLDGELYKIFVLEPERANLSRLNKYKDKIKIFQGDIRDSSTFLKIITREKIDVVVHLVSTMIPGSTLSHFQNEVDGIVMPTVNIMELCAEARIKFIYFSSGGTIYGNNGRVLHKEDELKDPISYYGLSKCLVEEIIQFEGRHSNLDYLIIRPSNPYGPGQNIHGRQGLIAVSIGKILYNEPLQIWGDGNAVRDYIYIDDLADAVYQLTNKNISQETINIGSGKGYSVNEIIHILSDIISNDIKVEYVNSRNVDVDAMVLDVSKLKRMIDFHPLGIDDGIRKFLKHLDFYGK